VTQRERVIEHRITTPIIIHTGNPAEWTIRWWIESDPQHGGISDFRDALVAVSQAVGLPVAIAGVLQNEPWTPIGLAKHLIDLVPAANSVEVCNDIGSGVCVHRDWP